MPATPADIARYTTDGVLLTSPADAEESEAIKAEHVDARGGDGGEIEMFFDTAEDGQALLDERFEILSAVNPLTMALEVEDSLGLGSAIGLSPQVPTFRLVDEAAGLDATARVRSYAADLGSDRFAVELLG